MSFIRRGAIPKGLSFARFREMREGGTFGVSKDGIEQDDTQKPTANVTDQSAEITG